MSERVYVYVWGGGEIKALTVEAILIPPALQCEGAEHGAGLISHFDEDAGRSLRRIYIER